MDCVTIMNQVLGDWKAKFDFSNTVTHCFHVNKDGLLCFGQKQLLLPAEDIRVHSAGFDASTIDFHLNRDTTLFLHVIWPEDKPAEIESVTLLMPIGNLGG